MRSTGKTQSGTERNRSHAFRRAAMRSLETLERRTLLAGIVVTTTADNAIAGDGLTTLREAITAANATPAVADTITFDLGAGAHTINLAGALPNLSTNMTIQGPGADLLSVRRDTGGNYRIFTVPTGAVTLAGLTTSNGVSIDTPGGAGIYNAATLTINDCVIRGNAAALLSPITAAPGGGISNDGTLTINNSVISDNTSDLSGGGINSNGTLIVNNSRISNNSSRYFGGGIWNDGTVTITGSTISDNVCDSGHGGGIWSAFDGSMTVSDSTISSNRALYGGGGIYNVTSPAGKATISDCTISENRSSFGAGIQNYSTAGLTVDNCTISGNVGPGVSNDGSLVVTDTTFEGNNGGLATIGTAAISGCTFSNNTGSLGGGIEKQGGSLSVTSSAFYNNTGHFAGGVFGANTITSSTFFNNTGFFAGGIADAGIIDHCTITGNTATGNSFQQYEGGVLGGTISNSIVAGNFNAQGSSDAGNFTDAGYNVIGGDPKLAPLADNGGPTRTMALLPDSPCINRGDPNYTDTSAFDQRGAPYARKIGPRIDIGAFESDVLNTPPTAGAIAPITVLDDWADSVINLRDSFDDAEEGAAGLVYTIVGNTDPALFTSASIDDASDVLTLNYAQGHEGVATLTIRATDSAGLFVEGSFDVTVIPPSFVVDSAADSLSFSDGARTLREAITIANMNPDANTITFDLGPGAHTINLGGPLPGLVTNMSIQGPGADLLTVRRDTGGDYSVFVIGDYSDIRTVTFAGMTIANGRAWEGGGVWAVLTDLTLSNVAIKGNHAASGGGLYVGGATVRLDRCDVSGNNADYYGGGIQSYADADVTVTDSTISGNTAARHAGAIASDGYHLTLINSTVSGNSAAFAGAIAAYSMVLNNCTISQNSTSPDEGGVGAAVQHVVSLTASNSVIAANAGGDIFNDIAYGPIPDISNHNFIGDDHPGVDPLLGALADNGGPTQTMALLPGSPLINAGNPDFAAPPEHDQRGAGFARILGGRLDIGAFEYDAPPTTTGVPDLTVAEDAANSSVNLRSSFNDREDGPAGLVYTVVGNTNPSLFAAASMDAATDLLALNYAEDASGVATITIRATDSQGQFVDDTFTVNVLSVQQQVQRLQQHVQALPGLKAGNRNGLLGKLALKGNDGDLDKVSSFIDGVQELFSGGKISPDNAGALVAAAEALLVSLG